MSAPLSSKLDWSLANPIWATSINPILANALLQGVPVNGIKLTNGVTTVSHGLGRTPIGFIQTDLNANVTYYRSADFNDAHLTLTSTGAATLNIWIY